MCDKIVQCSKAVSNSVSVSTLKVIPAWAMGLSWPHLLTFYQVLGIVLQIFKSLASHQGHVREQVAWH